MTCRFGDVCVCVYVRVCVSVCVCARVCVYECAHVSVFLCLCLCVHMSVCVMIGVNGVGIYLLIRKVLSISGLGISVLSPGARLIVFFLVH